jgi:hypothetical protein
VIQPSLVDERDLAEVASADFPHERLIVCRHPLLADERARKRRELLEATEKKLEEVAAATRRSRRPLREAAAIAMRVGRVWDAYNVGKHFEFEITDNSFRYWRNEAKIAQEAALDGIYVIRTSVRPKAFSSENTVRAYKELAKVERAFRSMKTVDGKVRSIFHWLNGRIRAHVFLCMLAYHVEWHLRQKLRSVLLDDHDTQAAEASRHSVVVPACRSEAAARKDATKRNDDGHPVRALHCLLQDLATLVKNRVRLRDRPENEFYVLTQPTPLQQHVFQLLDVTL